MTAKTLGGLVAVAAVTLALVAASPAAADPAPALPKPTGHQPVGTTDLYMKDTSRPDTWHPEVPYRELMVSLYYPAVNRGPAKRFMTEAEAQAVLDEAGLTHLSAADIAATRTDAFVDARPAGRRHPLVVLSPGFKRPRAELMSLSEDLASHGYVVALVDHTYENVATTFPDGRVTGCDACGSYDVAFWEKLTQGRATDVSFVLDQLTHSAKWGRLVDASRIGMAGHSVGGVSAIPAMVGDDRIRAGMDMDGTTNNPLATDIDRPFMFFGRANTYTPGTGPESDSWSRDWPHLTGWKRWLVGAGMQHPSFTDIGLVGEALGVDFGADTPAVRGSAITRAYVRAFFDQHLRGRHQPLLDQPSPRYPEVSIAMTSTPFIPAPTGPDRVGSTSMYLKDTSRPDPWVPSVPYRELMVSLYYPTTAHGERTRYLTAEESAALLSDSGLDVPPDWLTTVVTNSVADARPAGHRLPLVVLSPGYTKPRATLTALAEDLASHGNVVALVGHTYENTGTSFPDGRFLGCASCEVPHDLAFWQRLERSRAVDVSFVLDSLTHSPRWGRLIDASRIGMAGHSVGGASTLPAMAGDDRIKAGIDIDGTTHTTLTPPGLSRPFMFVSHQHDTATRCASGDDNWEANWELLTGWRRWIEVAGTQHASFTDVGLIGDQIGFDYGATLGAARTQAITRAYVNAFFDEHLSGRSSSVSEPEVMDCA